MTRKELLRAYGIIPVGKRTVAIVDAIDAPQALRFEWRLKAHKFRPTAYTRDSNGKVFYLHYSVCTEQNGPRPSPDHVCEAINGDSLDCRRENLRWSLKSETGYQKAKRLGDAEALEAYASAVKEQHTTIRPTPPPMPAKPYVNPKPDEWPERTH